MKTPSGVSPKPPVPAGCLLFNKFTGSETVTWRFSAKKVFLKI